MTVSWKKWKPRTSFPLSPNMDFSRMRSLLLLLIPIALIGCKNEASMPDTGDPGNTTYEEFVEFLTSGLTTTSWSYSSIEATYDAAMNVTTLETTDDPAISGKIMVSFAGGAPGTYRYALGGINDTNQVYIWFAPPYSGTPGSVFELTGVPADGLQATVTVEYFGDVGDSVTGAMSASLKLLGSSPPFNVVLYSGTFRVMRSE